MDETLTAYIDVTNVLKHTHVRTEEIKVASKQEALDYCKDQSWSVEFYAVDFLRDKDGNVIRV